MSVPIILSSGDLLVYGLGSPTYNGMQASQSNMVFGSVYQIWDGGDPYYEANDYLMFDAKLATVIYYGNYPYSKIEARLATKMSPPL